MATYGSFPGVRVTTQSGSISSVAIGEEEKLVLFGEPTYAWDDANDEIIVEGDDATLDVTADDPEQINAPREANTKFGDGSELAEGMKEALANGANINFLYGVAVGRTYVEGEAQSAQSGVLDNTEIVEHTGDPVDVSGDALNDMGIKVDDVDGSGSVVQGDIDVELRYDGAPATPTDDTSDVDKVHINPLTGDYAADQAPADHFEFYYTYNQYGTAFGAQAVRNVVNENETGVYVALSDSDGVSTDLNTEVSSIRNDYKLVNAFMVAEPNDNELYDAANTTAENGGADARYDTANYSAANQSVSANHFYKFAPGREENVEKTIAGGVGGLFAGNPITDPVYNEVVSGYDSLEQSLSKSDADNLRDEDIIPIRSGGSIRVKGNRATNFSVNDSVAADFWTRRITDRVILIGKQVGDAILGRINDESTRAAAQREIELQMGTLVDDRLIRGNEDEQNLSVNVYESSTNDDEVKIDIAFSPYGIVKRVDETITVDTN